MILCYDTHDDEYNYDYEPLAKFYHINSFEGLL